MPRSARIVIPNCPHHVVHRGHNRSVVFAEDQDYQYYLNNLFEWKKNLGCKLYGYCLMTNHVHLLIDPGEDSKSLGLLMKRVAGRQTAYTNALEGRTGSLWEGRFRSSPVDTNDYLIKCLRYIELNPLRAGIVQSPFDYKWSSVASRQSQLLEDIKPDNWKQYLEETLEEAELRLIRNALQRGQLTGNNKFIDEIENKINLRVSNRTPGRPKK